MRRNTETDFWARVERGPGCWEWTGQRIKFGYGRVGWKGRRALAHRMAWELTNGAIPQGLFVLHRCDNPPCCNPAHLFLGTRLDNIADMVAKGRQSTGGYQTAGEANPAARLTEAKVRAIRASYTGARGDLPRLAREFDVTTSTIWDIVQRRTWRAA